MSLSCCPYKWIGKCVGKWELCMPKVPLSVILGVFSTVQVLQEWVWMSFGEGLSQVTHESFKVLYLVCSILPLLPHPLSKVVIRKCQVPISCCWVCIHSLLHGWFLLQVRVAWFYKDLSSLKYFLFILQISQRYFQVSAHETIELYIAVNLCGFV